jgi:hypothetical protein
MVRPPYWQVFANPKSTVHKIPFAVTLIGNSIWAKDNTTAVGDEAIIETGLKLGDIIIVKIGVTCFKIVMR